MNFTRRDLLTWGTGAAAGLMLTPVPWKLLDDTSIWTQNWPWIPQPGRSPVEVKNSCCSLCPNGCGLRVRMAGGYPVGVSGMGSNPVTHGALCPLGFAAHQLNWHPRRLRMVRHRGKSSSWNEALAAFRRVCADGPVAIIDGFPGRAASTIFQAFARRNGSYRVIHSTEESALQPYATWSGIPVTQLGYDLENAGTVLSFGAPLLDGWFGPGRFTRLWSQRCAGLADPSMRLIQLESSLSRTADGAWRWVSIPPGSEAALAAALAVALRDEHLASEAAPAPTISLAQAASPTGVSSDAVRALARTIVARGPTLAIAAQPEPAVAALNLMLGAIGARGGIVRRRIRTEAYESADSPKGLFRAVLIDSSVPSDFTPPVDGEVFRFAAWDTGTSHADWLLPAPGFLEELTDIPSAPGSAIETYAVAPPLSAPPPEIRSAAQFLSGAGGAPGSVETVIHERCHRLFQARLGQLQADQALAVADLESAEALEKELRNGAVWVGEAPLIGGIHCRLSNWPDSIIALQRPETWTATWVPAVLPPLATKLYQESSLRESPARSRI